MGSRIRIFEPNVVFSTVVRCVDRQFLLKPDHHRRHPLLSTSCPSDVLDPSSSGIPVPSVINIIGAAAARALKLSPIRLHAIESNINHLGTVFSADKTQLENIPAFFRNFHSSIARQLNAKWRREGHFWGAPHRPTPCKDDPSAEQQLLYNMTNPVKDKLVGTVSESPFFNSFRALGRCKTQRYFLINWNAFHKAGGWRNKKHSPKNYLRWLELDFTPLPAHSDWTDDKRRTWVSSQIRDIERHERNACRREDRRAMGVAAQFAVDPRDRPADLKSSGPQPLCHCSDFEQRVEYRKRHREIRRAHRAASIEYRSGNHDVEFPEGTFRPPLIRICRADE